MLRGVVRAGDRVHASSLVKALGRRDAASEKIARQRKVIGRAWRSVRQCLDRHAGPIRRRGAVESSRLIPQTLKIRPKTACCGRRYLLAVATGAEGVDLPRCDRGTPATLAALSGDPASEFGRKLKIPAREDPVWRIAPRTRRRSTRRSDRECATRSR